LGVIEAVLLVVSEQKYLIIYDHLSVSEGFRTSPAGKLNLLMILQE
jgi:hypothetical protein